MQITFDSQPAPGQQVNEDLALAGPRFALVLDGATAQPGVDSGCDHDVAWYVTRLGGELARLLVCEEEAVLPDALAEAITRVRAQHAITCDLTNPDSPSSTVAIVRETADTVDYLVLADSPVVIRTVDGQVRPVHDGRVDRLPGYTPEIVRAQRNVPGGFWVAGAKPEAAYEALTGSLAVGEVSAAGIFSDGAARLVERHGMTWDRLLDLLEAQGPSQVIAQVRDADHTACRTDGGKRHDDATALLCRFRPQAPGTPAPDASRREDPARG